MPVFTRVLKVMLYLDELMFGMSCFKRPFSINLDLYSSIVFPHNHPHIPHFNEHSVLQGDSLARGPILLPIKIMSIN